MERNIGPVLDTKLLEFVLPRNFLGDKTAKFFSDHGESLNNLVKLARDFARVFGP